MSLNNRELVPNAPIREAFLQSGMTISDFARAMGFIRTVPHIQRARKLLGMEPDYGGRGRRTQPREHMDYMNALRAFEALGRDPVDLDLLLADPRLED